MASRVGIVSYVWHEADTIFSKYQQLHRNELWGLRQAEGLNREFVGASIMQARFIG